MFANLVGEGLEQLMIPVGNVTCNGFVKSELVSLLNDQCSASKVKSETNQSKLKKFPSKMHNDH